MIVIIICIISMILLLLLFLSLLLLLLCSKGPEGRSGSRWICLGECMDLCGRAWSVCLSVLEPLRRCFGLSRNPSEAFSKPPRTFETKAKPSYSSAFQYVVCFSTAEILAWKRTPDSRSKNGHSSVRGFDPRRLLFARGEIPLPRNMIGNPNRSSISRDSFAS